MKLKTLLIIAGLLNASAFAGSEVSIGLASNFSEISTGSSNPYGGYFKDGVSLALKDSAARLAAKQIKINLKQFDYGNSDIKVLDATRSAIASDVIAVLGYNYSSNALLAAPLHHEAKLPMLTPSASATRLSQMGRYVHQGCFDNAFMAETMAHSAITRLKAKSVALLPAANCAYCSDLADSFEASFRRQGGVSVIRIPILQEDKDFTEVIAKLKQGSFDVVVLPNQELTSARMIQALVSNGIKKPFLGADGWGNVGQEFFTILKGVAFTGYSVSHWHPDLPQKTSREFVSKYTSAFGKAPNDTSVLAYDSTLLLVDALLRAKSLTREGIEDSLNNISHFKAITGEFLFTPNKAPKKNLVLLKTNNSKFQVVESIRPTAQIGGAR